MDHSLLRVRILDSGGIAGELTVEGIHRIQLLKVANPSGSDFRMPVSVVPLATFTVEQP